jgi:hypothetical protein
MLNGGGSVKHPVRSGRRFHEGKRTMAKRRRFAAAILGCLLVSAFSGAAETQFPGASRIESHGYQGCILLENPVVRVILEPNCGGRVLEYSYKGTNAIYVDPAQDGIVSVPGKPLPDPCGGRCDIGPEMTVPRHPDLWTGKWTAEIIGPRAARMTSAEDKATGVQLIREFRLDENTSQLTFTQIIRNVSGETKFYCHWSRTFVTGGGICLVPISPGSRFPRGFTIYRDGGLVIRPEDHANYRIRDNFLIIDGEPPQSKFGLDSATGWLAYITKSNLLFVKRFPVYPERAYAEFAALTISIWYYKDMMCELEPIGPKEVIKPGGSASFTEEWWLLPYDYPPDKKVDIKALTEFVDSRTKGR